MEPMVFLVLAVALAVALLRGGRPRRDIHFRHAWLAVVALGMQLAGFLAPGTPFNLTLIVASYIMLLFVVLQNMQHQSLRLLFLGLLLNFVVIALNGGRIPVDVEVARALGITVDDLLSGTAIKHVAMGNGTVLAFLGDVIPIPVINKVISIGDIFIMLGTFVLVQELMGLGIQFSAEAGKDST